MPASDTGSSRADDVAAADEPLHEHGAQPVDQLRELDVLVALLRQHLVHRGDREDAVHRVLERLARVDVLRARLQAQQRRDGLQVVLHAMVDLLREHAAHDGAAVLERDRGVVRDRLEQRAVVVGERRVAIGDELADLARASSAAACAPRACPARPSGHAIRPSSSTSAAPVACTASIVVFTIASSDSSR